MLVRAFLEEGLGNSSYLIGSPETGIAAVVDPTRDIEPYLQTAQELGLRLAYALETHSHNDFISGCRELAAQTGAEVCASARAGLQFPHRPLAEGDEIDLGGFRLRVLETPGHTPEHISFLALDEQGQPQALNNIAQAAQHPQVLARDMLVEVEHPAGFSLKLPNTPIKLSRTPGGIRGPSPAIGEHSDEVLSQLLGLSPAQIAELRQAKVIFGPLPSPVPLLEESQAIP